ncbi:MAG: helix-turn-helix domain-containing protein [Clostridia bacterium]|nr:helix-turn-helix domain-containing protein [Clostridia bacterium]
MTKNEFCDSIKISKKSLNKFLNNNLDFEVESLIKIANLLKISAYDLLTLIE